LATKETLDDEEKEKSRTNSWIIVLISEMCGINQNQFFSLVA
jgi:hypothetical protein